MSAFDPVCDTGMVSGSSARLWTTSLAPPATARFELTSMRFVHLYFGDTFRTTTAGWIMLSQIYPWTKIQEAHREMEANKNRFAISLFPRAVLTF